MSDSYTIKLYRNSKFLLETQGAAGETLLSRIVAAGVFMDAPCGGQGKCGKCLVRLVRLFDGNNEGNNDGNSSVNDGISSGNNGGSNSGSSGGEQVLACQTLVGGDVEIHLPDEMEMHIADVGSHGNESIAQSVIKPQSATNLHNSTNETNLTNSTNAHDHPHRKLGVAIDIGTTTVVAHLTDMHTGARIATASGVNAQRQYGADVISRIKFCSDNGHEALTRLIREQLSKLITETCTKSGNFANDIAYISIAGNTIMQHLAAGYSPVGMGVVPFTTVSLFGEEMQAGTDLHVADNAIAYFAPAISAYVGGDITAGMLAAGLEGIAGPAVYLDIGTNGEIALKSGDRYYCCATAAGPAFEGAEITMGMAAMSGAINHVKWDNGLALSVVGGTAPRGLCGSGLLDALAVLLETGAVDETGRLLDKDEIGHDIREHISSLDGKNIFKLTKDCSVYMAASDIRKLQLAKSAIAAGIQTLLHHIGITEEDVKQFVLAGGFGSFMDQYSAARIGLIPRSFLPVARALGNTAGEGAAMALCSADARDTLSGIRSRCEYIELSSSLVFNEQFVEQMMF